MIGPDEIQQVMMKQAAQPGGCGIENPDHLAGYDEGAVTAMFQDIGFPNPSICAGMISVGIEAERARREQESGAKAQEVTA